jgi:hypothetical protein
VNDIGQIISRLEHQRTAIDRAILALREIEGPSSTKGSVSGRAAQQTVHRQNSASMKASPQASKEPATKVEAPKRGHLTAEGRRKLSLAAKKRWALAKRKGINAITGKSLGKAS